jgi:hypothetical protein
VTKPPVIKKFYYQTLEIWKVLNVGAQGYYFQWWKLKSYTVLTFGKNK